MLSWESRQEDNHDHFLVGVGHLCGLGHITGCVNVSRDPATTGKLETTQKIEDYMVPPKSLTPV